MMSSRQRDFPPELEFLLECVRPGEPRPKRLNELLHGIADHLTLVELARRHRVAPLCYAVLQSLGPDLRRHKAYGGFERQYFASAAMSAVLARRLLAVFAVFNQEHIPVIAFKGPSLSARLYTNLAFRTSTDLDFLVRPADFWKAVDSLTSEGWQPETNFSAFQRDLFFRSSYALPFVSFDGACRLDLHFRLTEHSLPRDFDVTSLVEHPGHVQVEGQQISTLNDAALLVYLAYHGALHFWSQLARLTDFVHLLASKTDWDWGALLSIAEDVNSVRSFLLALSLSAELFKCDLPDSIHGHLSADPRIKRFESAVVEHLIDGQGLEPSNFAMVRHAIGLIDSLSNKQKYMIRRFARPTQSDWAWLPLPDQLYPLYYLVRPFRLAWALTHNWHIKGRTKNDSKNKGR